MIQQPVGIIDFQIICSLGHDTHGVIQRLYNGEHVMSQDHLLPPLEEQMVLFGAADFDYKSLLGGTGWRHHSRSALMMCLAARKLLENTDQQCLPEELGVVVGYNHNIYSHEFQQAVRNKELKMINPPFFLNMSTNAVASQMALLQNIQGYSMTVTTGFTAGLEALHFAAQSIITKRASHVLTGAVEERLNELVHAFATYSSSEESSELFRHHKPGQVIGGEGCALLRLAGLDSLTNGEKDCKALFKGFAMRFYNGDDSGNCVTDAIEEALQVAGCQSDDINAVFLSANGHKKQDALEAEGLANIIARPLPAVALKGALGDTFHAGGAIAAAVATVALEKGLLPPTVHLKSANPYGKCILSDACQKGSFKNILVLSLDRTEKVAAAVIGTV